ncbi:MAG: hypothetical protein KTR13_02535 [Saprospiraceae bacterium]|nr:hypothetical protein [Saprospiraceae bacterium]
MRVFILSTGRCGSTSIVEACKYITNFSSGHETLAKELGQGRFDYADQHIESDNRLSWHLGQLHAHFGDEAFYVHLIRDREAVAQSFMKRYFQPSSVIDAFSEGIRMTPPQNLSPADRLQLCYDYIDTVNANIAHFISNKRNQQTIHLETIRTDFPIFWSSIQAEGSLEKALEAFQQSHNASSKRKLEFPRRLKLMVKREWQHLKAVFGK